MQALQKVFEAHQLDEFLREAFAGRTSKLQARGLSRWQDRTQACSLEWALDLALGHAECVFLHGPLRRAWSCSLTEELHLFRSEVYKLLQRPLDELVLDNRHERAFGSRALALRQPAQLEPNVRTRAIKLDSLGGRQDLVRAGERYFSISWTPRGFHVEDFGLVEPAHPRCPQVAALP